MTLPDPDRLRLAAARFHAFFEELRGVFVEREDMLTQIALALLSREHVLMTGPPGTAKSRLASATLCRIVDDETRQPSLFSRQFTESTVQTDLVGPIDFKTLIETGRTEHFTEEGMLGAVHAFLDEVFDGRDMLLRSALNVLHERELKQGTTTRRGQIECAVMTSNRYLSEILEGSRETLLAFVDRIAFVNFVPRGFSSRDGLEAVLKSQVGPARSRPLSKLLTLQDLDVLQLATDNVHVAEPICELLVTLLASFEREVAAAVRADPTFVPTRYLSTRTAVRLGNLLRAIAVHDWATGDRSRLLSAGRRDLRSLRFSLVSAGPAPEQLARLLESESDSRERRQLSILRTEREIFERCFAELPAGPEQIAPPAPPSVAAQVPEKLAPSVDLRAKTTEQLLEMVRELGADANLGSPDAERALVTLRGAVALLSERLLLGGLDPNVGEELAPRAAVEKLAALADLLEQSGADRRPIASWLRGQALRLLQECLLLGFPAVGSSLERVLSDEVDAPRAAQSLLDELSALAALDSALSGDRKDPSDRARSEVAWQRALERLENELVALWSEGVRAAVSGPMSNPKFQDLAGLITALDVSLERMTATERALDALGGSGRRLRQRTIGPRIEPFIEAAFARFDTSARALVVEQVSSALETLRNAGLADTVSETQLLSWTAEALLRSDPLPADASIEPGYDGYRALRSGEQRIALAVTLVEIALRALGQSTISAQSPGELFETVRQRLQELDDRLKDELVLRDLARIARPLEFLERWWAELDADVMPRTDPDSALRALVRSRFFHVTRDECALARFALESRLLAEVFPRADVASLERRVAELDTRSLARVEELLARRSDARWSKLTTAS